MGVAGFVTSLRLVSPSISSDSVLTEYSAAVCLSDLVGLLILNG